jgi:hypothetical protein
MLQALTEDAINSVTRWAIVRILWKEKINTVLGYRQDFLEV